MIQQTTWQFLGRSLLGNFWAAGPDFVQKQLLASSF
jgi:hypothetical protein